MSGKKQKIILGIVFLIGLLLFLYPIVGNILNVLKNKIQIAQYEEVIQAVEPNIYDEMFEKARLINQSLTGMPTVYDEDDSFYEEYKNALCLEGGMMGYLIIDKIDVNLAIYFGTSEDILQNSVGFLEGTHLPTGDIGNSTVLTGHTGLPTADLLTNLEQLEIGDTFQVNILNETFTYEVFEINVVLPSEVDLVEPKDDIDMVTLVTCTPYGVNSHRLLVHGKQIETVEIDSQQTVENQLEQYGVYVLILMVVILTIIIILFCKKDKTLKREENTKV